MCVCVCFTPYICKCPICDKVVRNDCFLWQHINVEHITRQSFPDASFLDAHERNVCSMCGFVYSCHCKYCCRTQGAGKPRCRGLMVKPSESKWLPNMTASSRGFPEPDKTSSASCYFNSFDSSDNIVQNEVTLRFLNCLKYRKLSCHHVKTIPLQMPNRNQLCQMI